MKKILSILIILFLILVETLSARGVGTSAANFLKMGYGARPSGMAGVFVALADDINSMEWNPAGLCLLEPNYFDAAFQHTFSFGKVESEILSYGQNLGRDNGAGLRIFYRHMPDINNNVDGENQVKVADLTATVGYGQRINNFSLGMNFKFITSKLRNYHLYGIAFDIGSLIYIYNDKISIGASIQNIGPDIKQDSLPLKIMVGAGYHDFFGNKGEHEFKAGLEINQPLDNSLELRVGGEYWYLSTVAGRLGYRQQIGRDDLQTSNILQHFTIGASICWSDLQLDYAFIPYADLGSMHNLSLALHYGPIREDIQKAPKRKY